MLFVLILIINAFFIGRHMHLSFEKRFKELTTTEKQSLMFSGILSTVCWISVFILGKMLF